MTKFTNTDGNALEGTEKALKAWEARKLGATLDQAAKVAGYANRGAAHNAIASLKRSLQMEAAEELVAMEEERLDHYLFALAPAIKTGDTQAINTAIKISERRAKLRGLDDFERRMAELSERKVAVEERDAVAVATAMANVIRKLELAPEQSQLARQLVIHELQALGTKPQVIRGELSE